MRARDEHRHGSPLADQTSLSKETGREGKGQNEDMNYLSGSLGSERASVADGLMPARLPFKIGSQKAFVGVDLAV